MWPKNIKSGKYITEGGSRWVVIVVTFEVIYTWKFQTGRVMCQAEQSLYSGLHTIILKEYN